MADLAEASLRNAARLLDDADVLLSAGRFPRAVALAVLATEEFGKCVMAVGSVGRDRSDVEYWRRFRRDMRHHPSKGEVAVEIAGDVLADPERWFAYQADAPKVAEVAQELKFAAIYVDLGEDGRVRTPESLITETLARVVVAALGAEIRRWDQFLRDADFRLLLRKIYPEMARMTDRFTSEDPEEVARAYEEWFEDWFGHPG